jgi:hypothetical protein
MDNRRIERTQLDRTDPLAPGGVAGTANDSAVDSPAFARQVAAALHERKGTVGKAVLRELVSEFVKPIVSDPQILSSDRAIAILEQLLTTVLPQLKESEEFNNLAKTVLGEEIEQRRQLRARGLEDTAT